MVKDFLLDHCEVMGYIASPGACAASEGNGEHCGCVRTMGGNVMASEENPLSGRQDMMKRLVQWVEAQKGSGRDDLLKNDRKTRD